MYPISKDIKYCAIGLKLNGKEKHVPGQTTVIKLFLKKQLSAL